MVIGFNQFRGGKKQVLNDYCKADEKIKGKKRGGRRGYLMKKNYVFFILEDRDQKTAMARRERRSFR